MRQILILVSTAVVVAAWGVAARAAGPATAGSTGAIEPQTSTCSYPFGAGNLVWCVSSNANLTKLVSPAGNQILPSSIASNEGYVLCSPTGSYYSLGAAEFGFGGATLVSLTSSAITISRTTTDGQFTLLQKISRDTNERDITIQMKLTNNGSAKAGVKLARFAEVGVDNDGGDDRYDASVDSLWAREAHAFSASPRLGIAHSIWIGDLALSDCSPRLVPPVPGGPGRVYFSNRFDIGNMSAGQSKTMYLAYRAQ